MITLVCSHIVYDYVHTTTELSSCKKDIHIIHKVQNILYLVLYRRHFLTLHSTLSGFGQFPQIQSFSSRNQVEPAKMPSATPHSFKIQLRLLPDFSGFCDEMEPIPTSLVTSHLCFPCSVCSYPMDMLFLLPMTCCTSSQP